MLCLPPSPPLTTTTDRPTLARTHPFPLSLFPTRTLPLPVILPPLQIHTHTHPISSLHTPLVLAFLLSPASSYPSCSYHTPLKLFPPTPSSPPSIHSPPTTQTHSQPHSLTSQYLPLSLSHAGFVFQPSKEIVSRVWEEGKLMEWRSWKRENAEMKGKLEKTKFDAERKGECQET